MAVTIPTDIPSEFTAGDTWRWTRSLADYPASEGGSLAYHFRGVGTLDVTAAADGDDFSVTVAAATTADLAAGTYTVIERVTVDGVVTTLRTLTRVVLPNVAAALAGALQSHEEKLIPILETAIRTRVAADLSSYTILGRSATKEELREYRQMLAEARAVVARQQHGGWLPSIAVHFGRP